MTIAELVKKHGLPVRIMVTGKPSWRDCVVRKELDDGWLVDYTPEDTDNFISKEPALNDYQLMYVE